MGKIVGVSFRRCGKVYRFDSNELDVFPGDWVVVETVRGVEMGQVLYDNMEIPDEDKATPVKPIIRKATPEDIKKIEQNKYLSAEAFQIGLDKIREHNLPMKLVEVEYTLEQSKIVFYFSAEGRVDFRDLVRDLASIFHKRIELHQIGVRDVCKMLGGIGPCGLTCCCSTFLTNFEPVSIKQAKDQGLSLNPVKISGTCGRLMCCLRYEYEQYVELSKDMPPVEVQVTLPEGSGIVVGHNIPKQTVVVRLPSNARLEYPVYAFKKIDDKTYEIKKGHKPITNKS
ncbi:MAG: stage 0 sporulation family protein [Vulcanimicrobiota bacterium]